MADIVEFKEAFSETDEFNIKVATRSGKEYWLHRDQIPAIMDGGLIYGSPLKPHPRSKHSVEWFDPKNVKIVG